MEIGFKTDQGLQRSNNEDAYAVFLEERLFIVADGVGGNNSGEVASKAAVGEIKKYLAEHPLAGMETDREIQDYFDSCIETVNSRVLQLSEKCRENSGMATTLVMAYLKKNHVYIINIGDSRAYLLRNHRMVQITDDHTYVNSLVKAGIISAAEARNHEQKHMITRAIGAEATVDGDFFKISLRSGDLLLLCTDGLYGEIEDSLLLQELDQEKPVSEMTGRLIRIANDLGGNDNITLIILKIMEEDIK